MILSTSKIHLPNVAILTLLAGALVGCGSGQTSTPAATDTGGEAVAAGAPATPAAVQRPIHHRVALRSDAIDSVTDKADDGYLVATADRLEMLELLRAREFGELTRILEKYQADFEADPFKEDRVIDAYDAFSIAEESLEPLLDAWVRSSSGHFPAYLARASFHYAMGWESRGHKFISKTGDDQLEGMVDHFDEARADIASAMTVEKDLALAYRLLVFMETIEGDTVAVEAAMDRAGAASADSYWVHSAYMMHFIPRWGGSYEAVDRHVKDTEDRAAGDPRFRTLAGRAAADRANLAAKEERYTEALQLLDEALSHGHSRDYYFQRSRTHRWSGALDEALLDVDAALAVNPQDPRALYHRAVVLTDLGRIDETSEPLALAHALDPSDSRYESDGFPARQADRLLREGHELIETGEHARALPLLDIAARLAPLDHEICYWRGRALLKSGDHPAALTAFELAVSLEPTHYDSYENIDWLLLQDQRYDDIIANWDTFLALQPDHADGHFQVAGTHKQKGDMDRAMEHLRKACDLGQQEACGILAR